MSKLSKVEYAAAYNRASQRDVPRFLAEVEDMVWAENHSADKEKAHAVFITKLKKMIVDYACKQDHIRDFSPKRNALTDAQIADEPFFLYFIKKAPELAGFFTSTFNDDYNYLRNPEVIKYLAMPVLKDAKCATGNGGRRNEIVNGKEPFPMRSPYYDKNGERIDDFKEDDLAVIREKLRLREAILTPVAGHFSRQYLARKVIKGEDINFETVIALQNIIKDYPDILAMFYDLKKENTFASYILAFPYRNPLDLLPAFANRNGLDNEGYPSSVDSKYTISPEEILWYGINTDNKKFVKQFMVATADVFSTQNRINEHIENIAKIAVQYPDYIPEIVAPFLHRTSYVTSKYPNQRLIAKHFQNVADETQNPAVSKEMAKVLSQVLGADILVRKQDDYDPSKTRFISDFCSKQR